MGLFWSYFRDTLRLPFIAMSGPLALLADGGSVCLDVAREVALFLRDQFFPSRCEDVYLARFGLCRGIVRQPLEPEEYWLGRVRFAYHWWARGGRASAMVEGLILGFGVDAAWVVNLRAEDPERWASFRVVLVGGAGDILLRLNQIKWAINEVKPARSWLAGMKFYAPTQLATRRLGIVSQTGAMTTIFPAAPPHLDMPPPGLYHGLIGLGGAHTIIYPREE